jgi:hypothetical protein
MAYKPSDMLITLTLVAGMLGILSLVILGMSTTYNVQTQSDFFNNESASMMQSVQNNVSTLTAYTDNMSTTSLQTDWLGGLFGQSWQAIRLFAKSIGLMTGLVDTGLDNSAAALGGIAVYVKFMLYMSIIVIVFVAILLRMILKEQT